MKRSYALFDAILVTSILIGIQAVEVANANPVGLLQGLPSITIQSDGSVVPQTDYIKQEDNIYYLTQNLSQNYRIVINCSNILFDGQGHVINGSNRFLWDKYWVDSQCKGITLEKVKNVTIRDVNIIGFNEPSIYADKCSEIHVLRLQTKATKSDISGLILLEESNNNVISNCISGIRLHSSYENVIQNNNVTLLVIHDSSNNLFFRNNICVYNPVIAWGSTNRWYNGSIGNYWSDFNSSYSFYEIDENNRDYFPLANMVLVDLVTPTNSPTPIPSPISNVTQDNNSIANPIVAIVCFIVILSVASISLVYFKRHKSKPTLSRNLDKNS